MSKILFFRQFFDINRDSNSLVLGADFSTGSDFRNFATPKNESDVSASQVQNLMELKPVDSQFDLTSEIKRSRR